MEITTRARENSLPRPDYPFGPLRQGYPDDQVDSPILERSLPKPLVWSGLVWSGVSSLPVSQSI